MLSEFLISFLASVGGAAVIAGAVTKLLSDHLSSRWLQKHKGALDLELETHRAALAKEAEAHKLTLKRQELLFARELEAADAFMSIWRASWPQYSRPDMEWDDVCMHVASNLGKIEGTLEGYLERHSVAISPAVREAIEKARSEAASEKFFEDGPDEPPPRSAISAAERVLDGLKFVRETILSDLTR